MRFVPRGFVHLSGLISFNEDIGEALSGLSWAFAPHSPGYQTGLRATAGRIFGGESLAGWPTI